MDASFGFKNDTMLQAEQSFTQSPVLRNAIAIIFVIALISWMVNFVKYRKEYENLHGSLVKPPSSLLAGTIPLMVDVYKTVPSDIHPHVVFTLIRNKYKLSPLYILDCWPLVERQIVISDPGIASQIISHHNKHPSIKEIVGHICGSNSMLYSEPKRWKRSRASFNPGFSVGHLMTLVGTIVDNTLIFKDILQNLADKDELFCLEPLASRLAIDVMGTIVLDHELNSLTTENPLVDAFRQASYYSPPAGPLNPFGKWNPYYIWMQKRSERTMNNYLSQILQERFLSEAAKTTTKKGGRKPVIDLAIAEYYNQIGETASQGQLDESFKWDAIDQMKTFLFAGHDTTSSTLCYVYYLLAHHPEALEKLQAEHDDVLGKDVSVAADVIRNDPYIINKLEYTQAVIKETLRLYPPASSVRKGAPDMKIVYNGETLDTTGSMVWIHAHSIHRREDLWPSPDEFIPERFLPAPNNWQEVAKDAWRPFEKGPRACIGQELAMIELRIFLALTIRELHVQPDYEAWDRKMGREKPGDTLNGRRGVYGYRSYQILHASAKPSDDMPVRVKRRI